MSIKQPQQVQKLPAEAINALSDDRQPQVGAGGPNNLTLAINSGTISLGVSHIAQGSTPSMRKIKIQNMIRRTATTKKSSSNNYDEDTKEGLYGDEDDPEDAPSICKTTGAPANITTASDSNTRYTSNVAPSQCTALNNHSSKFSRVQSTYDATTTTNQASVSNEIQNSQRQIKLPT